MEPLKIFWSLREWLHAAEDRAEEDREDPFQDPDIQAMNSLELADLPFPSIYHADLDLGAPPRKCA
ncbi:hypothetical protein [Rhizobium sp. LC145]|uniref:hypothetical protein n=1 Tax=Rhizobium sp. LC145 TaxID=1120688 RepID=UPI00062A0A26|nr:hypothetical protein [Rhizobium sp. LC145]KKX28175.1 hypothetical protein YH62_18960 [Rhizobium sp. LC145]TKT46237.1 hypothetical protein FDR95_23450 [Rhizobiaceae bacterium LC148]